MAGRTDPERIHAAHRAAGRRRPTDYGLPLKTPSGGGMLRPPAAGYRGTGLTRSSARRGSPRNVPIGHQLRAYSLHEVRSQGE